MSDRVFNRREFLLILLTIVLVIISCTLPTGQTASPAEPAAVTVLIYTALVQVTSAPVVTEAPPIATDQPQAATEVIQSTPEPQTETPQRN